MPVLYIITGSNGAGKSSIGPDYLPTHLRDSVFDGDKLLMQKRTELWKAGVKSPKEYNRLSSDAVDAIFDGLVETALTGETDFAYEGHFTTDATWGVPKRFKAAGYKIHLIFFGLKDITLSETRVIGRAKEGGHNVDPMTLTSNFYGNLQKLDEYFGIFDTVRIVDTSGIEHIGLALLKKGKCISAVAADQLPNWFIENLPNITRLTARKERRRENRRE